MSHTSFISRQDKGAGTRRFSRLSHSSTGITGDTRQNSRLDVAFGGVASTSGSYQRVSLEDPDERSPATYGLQRGRPSPCSPTHSINLEGQTRFPALLQQTPEPQEDFDMPKEYTWRDYGKDVLSGVPFQLSMGAAILSNALVIGFETDMPKLDCWESIENFFLAIFALDLFLRIAAYGSEYLSLKNPDFLWNLLDLSIVGFGLFDFVAGEIMTAEEGHHKKGGGMATLFRMVRLLRILRIFKIVRFLKQLYLLAFGFAEAAQAVFWVTILMNVVLYICAIVLVRTVGRPEPDDPDGEFWSTRYGDVIQSMITLFELMTVPNLQPYAERRAGYPITTLFMIIFIIFGSFGMIALLTGVISESMFEKNQIRVETERFEREKTRKLLSEDCKKLYEQMEFASPSGATRKELEEALPFLEKIFEYHNVSYIPSDLENAIENMVMDNDGDGFVSKEEFWQGILGIAEGVRPTSIMELFHTVSLLKVKVDNHDTTLQRLAQQQTKVLDAVIDLKIMLSGKGCKVSAGPASATPSTTISKQDEGAGLEAKLDNIAPASMAANEGVEDLCLPVESRRGSPSGNVVSLQMAAKPWTPAAAAADADPAIDASIADKLMGRMRQLEEGQKTLAAEIASQVVKRVMDSHEAPRVQARSRTEDPDAVALTQSTTVSTVEGCYEAED